MTDHPACPYANRGLDAGGMSSCPSYVAAELSLVLSVSGGAAPRTLSQRGVYCGHLGLQESRRTFGVSSACTHPDGPPRVATIELAGRRLDAGVEPAAESPHPS